MYRHFAVITVAATLLVAVFDDGENRQAFAEVSDAHKQAAERAEYEAHRYGKP